LPAIVKCEISRCQQGRKKHKINKNFNNLKHHLQVKPDKAGNYKNKKKIKNKKIKKKEHTSCVFVLKVDLVPKLRLLVP
jgi:hypothetical protein